MTPLVALGVAQLVAAALASPLGAPVGAVGELSINHTPPAVKNFAIRTFGSNDKTVLVWGIRGVLIIFAVIIGIMALRKLAYGLAGLTIFAAIGVYAALSQPTATVTEVWPTLIGAAVAAFALRYFARLAGGPLAAGRLAAAASSTIRPVIRLPRSPWPRRPDAGRPATTGRIAPHPPPAISPAPAPSETRRPAGRGQRTAGRCRAGRPSCRAGP